MYLIAELDCGLDHWTGLLLDWTATGLIFQLKLCVSHNLHPIRCTELDHMFNAQQLDCHETEDGMHCGSFAPKRA